MSAARTLVRLKVNGEEREAPAVEVEIIDRPGERPLGAGEAAMGPTAAAIANAVFDALGVRVRSLPLTAGRIAAAI